MPYPGGVRSLLPLLLVPLLGCPSGEPGRDIDRSCALTGGPIESDWIPLFSGHSYDWLYLSHRIAYLRAGVGHTDEDGAFSAPVGLIGGDWSTGESASDFPWFGVQHRRVRAPGLRAWVGTVETVIPADGRADEAITVDLAAAGLADSANVAVAVQGLCFDSALAPAGGYGGAYRTELGWTPRGFGVGVDSGEREGDSLPVSAAFHFQAGALDRPVMNGAVPFAQVRAVLSFIVLGWDEGFLTTAEHETRAFYMAQGESYTETPRLPEADRTLQIDGAPDWPIATPLLRSWDFELNRAHDPDRAGRYLRGWHAQVEGFEYEGGIGTVLLDGWLSHSSAFQEGDLEIEFKADIGLLQLPEGSVVVSGEVSDTAEQLGSLAAAVPPPEL